MAGNDRVEVRFREGIMDFLKDVVFPQIPRFDDFKGKLILGPIIGIRIGVGVVVVRIR